MSEARFNRAQSRETPKPVNRSVTYPYEDCQNEPCPINRQFRPLLISKTVPKVLAKNLVGRQLVASHFGPVLPWEGGPNWRLIGHSSNRVWIYPLGKQQLTDSGTVPH
jgi:hypothetical protein